MIHFKEVILGLQEEPVDVTMRVLRASGICAVISAWLTIATGIYRNPWFVLTRNAFSDLGGPRAADPWIYDSGMLITAALLMAFSAYLLATSRNRVESMGASFASIAGDLPGVDRNLPRGNLSARLRLHVVLRPDGHRHRDLGHWGRPRAIAASAPDH
jgi:hypothetical protein